jgi:hypothetical protein
VTELPDLTDYSRESLIELVKILHESNTSLTRQFDEAIAIVRTMTGPVDTENVHGL